MLSEDTRTACADPYYAIGYAKGSIETALNYLALEDMNGVRDWLRTAYESLDSVEYGCVRAPF